MKDKILVVFGGNSVESEISIITAVQAIKSYKGNSYELIPIFLSRSGRFYYHKKLLDLNTYKNIESITKWTNEVTFLNSNSVYYYCLGFFKYEFKAVWIIMHGKDCEDGTVSGYFRTLQIPTIAEEGLFAYIGQDKIMTKKILKSSHILQIPFIAIEGYEYKKNSMAYQKELAKVRYPSIVKPSTLGSSIGISICNNKEELLSAIDDILLIDDRIIIEKYIKDAKEYNISMLGYNGEYACSAIEEVNNKGLLSYKDKYQNKDKGLAINSRVIQPDIPLELQDRIKNLSYAISKILHIGGVVRIDYLYDIQNDRLYFSEINNIPGSLSFYLWEKSDLSYTDLIEYILNVGINVEYKRMKMTRFYSENVFSCDDLPSNLLKK